MELNEREEQKKMIMASGVRKVKPAEPIEALAQVWPWNFAADVIGGAFDLSWRNEEREKTEADFYRIVSRLYVEGFLREIEKLPERSQEILRMRYREGKTLEECGRVYGVTRDRVRQIEVRTMRILRGHWDAYLFRRPEDVASMEKDLAVAAGLADGYRKKIKKMYKALGVPFPEGMKTEPEEEGSTKAGIQEDIKIGDLELSVRSYNCLCRANIRTLKQLSEMTYEQLCKVRNLGRKSIEEIEKKCWQYGVEIKREAEQNGTENSD